MTDDETIDGPRTAAQILNSMPASQKNKLLRSIADKDPATFQKIEENIFHFEDIAQLTDPGLQRLIKEVPHQDLVLSLKTASDQVKQALLRNMSQRKATIVLEDLQSLPPTRESEVEDAKKKIVQIIDRLRTAGAIHSISDSDEFV